MEPQTEPIEAGYNFTALLMKMLDYWYLFVISVLLALLGGYLYFKYTSPVYEVYTTLMVENESPSFSSERVLEDMNMLSEDRNILNEKIILKSYDIVNETLKQLNFGVTYYFDNGYLLTELYKDCPFIVAFDTLSPQLLDVLYSIEFLSENKFRIKFKGEGLHVYSYQKQNFGNRIDEFEFSKEYTLGDEINSAYFNFRIFKNMAIGLKPPKPGDKYKFVINNLHGLTLRYKESLNVDLVQEGVDVFAISLQGNNIAKITDFLNHLTNVYILEKLDKKNLIANNTIRFIDNQLFSISDSLLDAENRLQKFRSSSKMMDITFQTEELFQRLSDFEKEKAVLLSQRRYFDYALKSIKEGTNLDDMMIPSTMGIADENLNTLVIELTDLSSKKATLSANTTEKSQVIINIEARIEYIKKLIINNLNNLIELSEISLRNIDIQISGLEKDIKKLPATQQKLIGYERQFTLNNEIYNFLMQKRAEAQIAKASNTPDSEIIDIARSDVFKKKSVKYSQILMIALFLGIVLPAGGIFLSLLLKESIVTRQDLESITNIPIVGSILQSKLASTKVFIENPKSPIAESFRSLYTNLQYFTRGNEHPLILISSSIQGEGKTFTAINLASVYASFGRKTCLLSFDLRLAKVHLAFNIPGDIGLSTYLINKSKMEEIIYPSGIEKLDIIPAGPAPPNPLELIASARTSELIAILKSIYHCVIIDSPPLAVVSDALFLAGYCDVNVIVTRQNHTLKKVLSAVVNELEANGIKNKAILFNGIKPSRIAAGYAYTYGYGYYKNEKEIWWKRIFGKAKQWKKSKAAIGI